MRLLPDLRCGPVRWMLVLGSVLLVSACSRSGYQNATVEIEGVDCAFEQVYPGQRSVAVSLRLTNHTTAQVEILEVGLRFTRAGIDVGADYLVQPDTANPRFVAAETAVTLDLWVNVDTQAKTGGVEIGGFVRLRLEDGLEGSAGNGGQSDGWNVIDHATIMVTTSEDEDDTAGVPSLEAAGGSSDVSLREALLIANAAAQPQVIRFDPAMFPPEQPVEIVLIEELGHPPPISTPGTLIDANDSGVTIVRASNDNPCGLLIQADDVTINGLTMEGFYRYICYAIEAYGVDRVTIVNCTFRGNGGNVSSPSAQVLLRGGNGHEVSGNLFMEGSRTGLYLLDAPRAVTVQDNRFIGNDLEGLVVSGSDHLISDNLFQGNGTNGIRCEGVVGVEIRDNRFENNGYSDTEPSSSLALEGLASFVRIESNYFTGNGGDVIEISDVNTSAVTISACNFELNVGLPIYLAPEANQGVLPPDIQSFDGRRISGTTGAGDGRVELYAVDGASWTYLGSADSTGSSFDLDLSELQETVAATFTTSEGSTSALSDTHQR